MTEPARPAPKPQPKDDRVGAFPGPWSFDGAADAMAEEFAAQWRRLLADVRRSG